MAKIDVIIPIYNAGFYLKKCLDSIINQAFKDFKIIAINDLSTDNSLEILERYKKQFPNLITIVNNSENKGAGYSRNVGLTLSDGDYVTFVDSDDFIAENLFYRINLIIDEYNPDIIRCDTKFNLNGYNANFLGMKRLHCDSGLITPQLTKDYIYKERPSVTAKFIKRELINTTFPNGLKWEDYAFIIPYLTKCNKLYILNDIGYYYNINPMGTTTTDIFKFTPRLLDIFIATDIINRNISDESQVYFKEELRIARTMNCLQRVRDLSLNIDVSNEDKVLLANLLVNLIKIREGDYHELDWYKYQIQNAKFYGFRMNIIEKMLSQDLQIDTEEETVKHKIKLISNKYLKKVD